MTSRAKAKVCLLVQFSARRSGSTFSGLQIADGLLASGWQTHVAFGHQGPMIAEYQKAGHITSVVEHRNWLRRDGLLHFLQDFTAERRNAKKIETLLKQVNPAVVYINTAASVAGVLAARRQSRKVIWHLRELFADVGGEMHCPGLLKPWVQGRFPRWADQLVCNSHAVAANLLGGASDQAQVIHNAVSEEYFAQPDPGARAKLGLPNGVVIIGVPGTLRPVKGHEFLLEAAVLLKAQHPDWQFAISGDGKTGYVDYLKTRSRQLGLEHNVHFLGTLPGLKLFFDACDLVCIPSRAESFGRVAIEAMAAGKAVVASDVGGLREIINPGLTGVLVRFGDAPRLATQIAGLIGDERKKNAMVMAARADVREHYSLPWYQAAVVQLLEEYAR